jgi:hypothetical protein
MHTWNADNAVLWSALLPELATFALMGRMLPIRQMLCIRFAQGVRHVKTRSSTDRRR